MSSSPKRYSGSSALKNYFSDVETYETFNVDNPLLSASEFELDNTRFTLQNCSTAFANCLRRCMLSEIPTYAFDNDPAKTFSFLYQHDKDRLDKSIMICKNSSSIHNEFISHRVSLIPLKVPEYNRIVTYYDDQYSMRRFKSHKHIPEFVLYCKNTIETRNKVKNGKFFVEINKDSKPTKLGNNEMINVTTDMFYIESEPKTLVEEDVDNYIIPDKITGDYILLMKLKPGIVKDDDAQELHIRARPNVGIGRYHSRYSPVGTVAYSFRKDDDAERHKKIFLEKLRNLNSERKRKQLEEYHIDEIEWSADDTLDSAPPDIEKMWKSFKVLDSERIYTIDSKGLPSLFDFVVESNGNLLSKNIVYSALEIMHLKLIDLQENIHSQRNKHIRIVNGDCYMKCYDFILKNETHTFGNLLAKSLQNNTEVEFAAYKMPHPLQKKVLLRIKIKDADSLDDSTRKDRTITIFINTITNLIELITRVKNEWREKTDSRAHFYDINYTDKPNIETVESVYKGGEGDDDGGDDDSGSSGDDGGSGAGDYGAGDD